MVGGVGSGKTTAIKTLKGKKFVYCFDPNAAEALAGTPDCDIVVFTPDVDEVDTSARVLKRGAGEKVTTKIEPTTYNDFRADFQERLDTGFFKPYTWVCLDSYTTLSDIIMDRVRYLNGRYQEGQPQQDDWAAQMETLKNVTRLFVNCGANVLATAHQETYQDEHTKRVFNRIMLTGRMRVRIPSMFSHVFAMDGQGGEFGCWTVREKMNETVRTHIKGTRPYEELTIDDKKPLVGQGLGRLLNPITK